MKLYKFLSTITLIFMCFAILAAEPAPITVVKQASQQTINALQKNKRFLKNKAVIRGIVTKIMLPHFAIHTISRAVVGRVHWTSANAADKQKFVTLFTDYVIDMYSSALASYTDEKVEVQPLRKFSPTQTNVLVYSKIIRSDAPPLSLHYSLVKAGTEWKVYDFKVDGVSMIRSYRSQFSPTLRKSGLQGLIKKLQERKSN